MRTAAAPFATSSAITRNAAPGAGRAEHVRRPHVAAARHADIDAGAPGEQKRERNRAGQIAKENLKHHRLL